MSSPSGVNNSSGINPHLQIMNIEAASEEAMEEAKKADKAERLNAEDLASAMSSNSSDAEVLVTPFIGPELPSGQNANAEAAAEFLGSSRFGEAQEEIKERIGVFMTELFTRQTEVLLAIKEAMNIARESQSQVSQRLSDLNSLVTEEMGQRLRDKAIQTFSSTVAGAVATTAIAGGAAQGGARASSRSRSESKDYHVNRNQNQDTIIEQRDALRELEAQGKGGTKEHIELQSQLDKTEKQGRQLEQAHELHQSKEQQRSHAYMALQSTSGTLGGMVGGAGGISEAFGQADFESQSQSRDQQREMRQRSEEALNDLARQIEETLKSVRDAQQAASDVIGAFARNI